MCKEYHSLKKYIYILIDTRIFVVVQSIIHVRLFATPWTAASQVPLSSTISWSLLRFMSNQLVMLSNHLILCRLFSFCLQSFPASGSFPMGWLFTSDGQILEFQLQHQSFWWIFRVWFHLGFDWFDLLACQGTLKSLLQHHNLKASILWCSAFFMAQLSHLYRTTGKTVALMIWTFVSKVMSLPFNTLSRFVIAFLPRSRRLLTSWLQSLSTVILEPKKIKSVTASTFAPFICHEVMGLDAMILVFWMLNFKPAFSLSSFTLIKLFSSSSLSVIRVESSAYLRLLIFLPAVLIAACDSSSPAFHNVLCM